MKKPQPEPTVYLIVAPVFLWRAKRYPQGSLLSVTPHADAPTRKIETKKLQNNVESGAIRVATPEEVAQGGGKPAPAIETPVPTPAKPEPAPEPYIDQGAFAQLDPREIVLSPVNPRRHFADDAMRELTDSVREKGVRVAINVRPMPAGRWFLDPGARDGKPGWFIFDRQRFFTEKDGARNYHHLPFELMEYFFSTREEAEAALPKYEIVAGERRWRAARYAGCETIRAVVEDMADLEAAELQVIENDQRADLTPLESAAGYDYLLRQPGYDMKKLVQRTGKSKSVIYERLKLLELPKIAQDAVVEGRVPMSTAQLIGSVDESLREEAAKQILGYKDSYGTEFKEPAAVETYREAEHTVAQLKKEAEAKAKREACIAELERQKVRVLKGKEADKVWRYGSLNQGGGHVQANEVCPRDPKGRTWEKVLKDAPEVERRAVVVKTWNDPAKAVLLFEREQANAALKRLGLWDAEGSEAAKKKAEQQQARAEKERREARMHADFDRIVEKARGSETAHMRGALACALAALTRHDSESLRFVCERRKLAPKGKTYGAHGEALRERASTGTLADLAALVAELSAALLGDSWNFRQDGRQRVMQLLGIEAPADECPDVRNEDEDDADEDEAPDEEMEAAAAA